MEKPLRITGLPEAVEKAKQLVTGVLTNIDDRDSVGNGSGSSKAEVRDPCLHTLASFAKKYLQLC